MNEVLVTRYRNFVTAAFIAAVCVHFTLYQLLLSPLLANQGLAVLAVSTFFSCVGAYGFIYRLPLFAYERYLWRWFNQRYDISGVWQYTTSYEQPDLTRLKKSEAEVVKKFFEQIDGHNGQVRVEQDALTLRIADGHGKAGRRCNITTTWKASARFSETDAVNVEFEIALGTSPPYRGRDHLKVIERSDGGCPSVMEGPFFLAVDSLALALRGRIRYELV